MDGMTPPSCEVWRGDLAMAAVGRLQASERRALLAHLDSCPGCRAELTELETVSTALPLADPARAVPRLEISPGPSPAPRPSAAPGRSRWYRPRVRLALAGMALAGGLAAATLLWIAPAASPHPIALSLSGTRGVHATALLTAEHWGTELSLTVAGQPGGTVYHVSMESRSGTWWQAGSYRATAGTAHVELACGVAPAKVDRIWVRDSLGQLVLWGYIA